MMVGIQTRLNLKNGFSDHHGPYIIFLEENFCMDHDFRLKMRLGWVPGMFKRASQG
jgi:hypothetical protein